MSGISFFFFIKETAERFPFSLVLRGYSKKWQALNRQRAGALSSLRLWVGMPSRLEDVFSCHFLNKTEL